MSSGNEQKKQSQVTVKKTKLPLNRILWAAGGRKYSETSYQRREKIAGL